MANLQQGGKCVFQNHLLYSVFVTFLFKKIKTSLAQPSTSHLTLTIVDEFQKSVRGDALTFGTGVLMSRDFLRPPNNETDILEDSK